MNSRISKTFSLTVLGFLLFVFGAADSLGQGSDYLTTEEIELIRFHQEIDKRMDVYVKAVERRFLSISGTQTLSATERKRLAKDAGKWGELPKGSRSKIVSDIELIVDEAINKIDDVASRDPESDLFKGAVHILAEAAETFIPRLKTLADQTQDARDRAVISTTIGYCNDIIEAAAKVRKPTRKKKKSKKKTS